MRWRALSIVMLATAAMTAGAPLPACAQQWAEKMFDHLEYDFGSVARGAEAQHRFPVKNIYKEDLHISSTDSSCGCTAASVTKNVLKSGETAYVVADFNTQRFQGFHSATVRVNFDGQFAGQVQLQVKGNIRKDVVFIPGKIDLGTVDAGLPAERKIHVAYAGRSDWQIVDVRSANGNFEVELNPKEKTPGRVDYELLFRLKPTTPAGTINDRLTIVTNDGSQQLIPLAVEGTVVSAVTVSPSSLQMGSVKAGGKTAPRQLIVKGKSEFRVLRVECDDPAFQCQVSDQPKKLHLIPVTYTAGEAPGKIVRKLRVVTDLAGTKLPEVVAHVLVQADVAETSELKPAAAAQDANSIDPTAEKKEKPAVEETPATKPDAQPESGQEKPSGKPETPKPGWRPPSERKSAASRIS